MGAVLFRKTNKPTETPLPSLGCSGGTGEKETKKKKAEGNFVLKRKNCIH